MSYTKVDIQTFSGNGTYIWEDRRAQCSYAYRNWSWQGRFRCWFLYHRTRVKQEQTDTVRLLHFFKFNMMDYVYQDRRP